MEVNNNLKKIKLLLESVIEEKIVLNEHEVEKLMRFLSDPSENSPGKLILESPIFSDLVFQFCRNFDACNDSVKVIIVSIVRFLIKNELQFANIFMQGLLFPSYKVCVLKDLDFNPAPRLHYACIQLATVHISHCSGLQIITENKLWQKILKKNLYHKPKHISNAACNFMAKLVLRLYECNKETELLEVLQYIVEPILATGYSQVQVFDAETDKTLCQEVFTHLSALLAVISEESLFIAPESKIMMLIKDYFFLDHKIYDIMKATKIPCFLKLINTYAFRYHFALLYHLLHAKKIDEFCNKMAVYHRNYIVLTVKKREAYAIVDFVIQTNVIWHDIQKAHATEIKSPLTIQRNGQEVEYSLQIIIHLLVPLLAIQRQRQAAHPAEFTEILEQFMIKVGKSITDYIYTCCFTFATLLEEGGVHFTKKVAIYTLKDMLRLKGRMNARQAGTMFQGLFYLLERFILFDVGENELIANESLDQDDLTILSQSLEAIKMILKEHTIPWHENLEIVCIQSHLLNLLKQHFLTPKHIVQVLDLINICVTKFLSPSMSLLVESTSTQACTLNEVGEVTNVYAMHKDWEVRDSAFNILHSCTEISFIKYTPLQKVIQQNNLMSLAAEAAMTDPEPYAQCVALRCLAAATKIESIWQEVLGYNKNIHIQFVNMVKTHTEGMVRKEAVNVLTRIYLNQKLSPIFLNALYEVMVAAALDDLHWEVQLAALTFWKSVIDNGLCEKGVIDGQFPSVIFSKEKRKIIVLNDREIHNQLASLLNHLSKIGCLTVLHESMNEINSIKVIEQAQSIAKGLMDILDKFKFDKVSESATTETDQPSKSYVEHTPIDLSSVTSEAQRNDVIDDILRVDNAQLLINLHDNYSAIKMQEMDIDDNKHPQIELVTPNKFLKTFRNNGCVAMIENSTNYSKDTLDIWLDEILKL